MWKSDINGMQWEPLTKACTRMDGCTKGVKGSQMTLLPKAERGPRDARFGFCRLGGRAIGATIRNGR